MFNLLLAIVALTLAAYLFARNRAQRYAQTLIDDGKRLDSLPFYYGILAAFWCALPALAVMIIWSIADNSVIEGIIVSSLPESIRSLPADQLSLQFNLIENIAQDRVTTDQVADELVAAALQLKRLQLISDLALSVLCFSAAAIGCALYWLRLRNHRHARHKVELIFKTFLLACASAAIFTTIGILASVLFESWLFFQQVSPFEFLFGLNWSPQTAIHADQVAGSGAFGALPLFLGTLLISLIALLIAVPTGLMIAIYLAEYASPRVREIVKPLLEVLAGIPTVVYGFFAALTVAPLVKIGGTWVFDIMGIAVTVSSESALAAGLVMGIMIIPFVSSLSDDVITAVPQSLREGSLAMGATESETIKRVVIPAALPGVVGGILLAASRAIGETMIVVMAAGMAANLTANPLESVTTVTVQIVALLVGDQEFDSAKTLSAFALGLMLFMVTLSLNYVALRVVKRYRDQYE